jgi:hypothetical protein
MEKNAKRQRMVKTHRDKFILVLALVLSVVICAIGLTAMGWRCYSQSWFGGIVVCGMGLIGSGLILASIIYLVLTPRKNVWTVGPLVISICTILVFFSAWRFREAWQDFRFRSNLEAYRDIVQLVESGEIQPDEHGFALLPEEYRHLSDCGGEIMIDSHNGVLRVFFFTYRDIYDDFAGYLYRSDNKVPQSDDFPNRPTPVRSWQWFREVEPHWFYCSNA